MIDLEVFRQTLSCVAGFKAGTGAELAKERVERRRKGEDGDDQNGHQMQRDEPVQGYACRKQCRCQVRSGRCCLASLVYLLSSSPSLSA